MDSETEVIKHQMAETRQALSNKLGVLEEQVATTVKDTTETVSQTVEAVKETVENTVHTVAESVKAVKEAFDLKAHVENHPWMVLAGAAALGYVLGNVIPSASSGRRESSDWSGQSFEQHDAPRPSSAQPQRYDRPAPASQPTWSPPPQPAPSPEPSTSSESSLWSNLEPFMEKMGPFVDKLKGLALGVTAGVAGEVLLRSVPEGLKENLGKMIDDFTRNLGGTVLRQDHASAQKPSHG